MPNWNKRIIDLGTVKEKTKQVFSFLYTGEVEIHSAVPGCTSCTKVHVNPTGIEVHYTPDPIPNHIVLLQGFQMSKKMVVVYFVDGTQDVLYFTAKIVK
jgi:hypothetical protein